ncbi:MAG: glycosyltransferase [Bacteriovoracaceae bacterium]
MKKILVIGHSLVVDANRKFWSVYARENKAQVTLVFPEHWKSNLIHELRYTPNSYTDELLNLVPMSVHKNGNASFYFYSLIKMWKLLKNNDYDTIIVTQETWSMSALQIGFLLKCRGKRKTKAHLSLCQNIKKENLKMFWSLERFITSLYDKMYYCDSAICDVLRWKKIPNKTYYLPFTYDSELYTQLPKNLGPVLRLGFLGRLTSEKGLLTLLKALDLLSMPVELIVAGNGNLKEMLMKHPKVRYLGVLPHKEAHHFYENIDFLVLPSETTPFWKEQFGRVLVEAMARGKVPLGSSSGAIPEVLGKIGLKTVFKERSVEDLVTKIEALYLESQQTEWDENIKVWRANNERLFSHQGVARKLGHELENES